MGYKAYPEYKESGLVFLGKIPSHWKTHRLSDIAEIITSNVDKKSLDSQETVRLCNYVDVYKNEKIDSSLNFMTATASDIEIKRFHLLSGDVIITKDSESPYDIGVPALVTESAEDLLCGYHLSIVRPQKSTSGSFLFYSLHALTAAYQFSIAANGVTRFGLTTQGTKNIYICVPTLMEQERISALLNLKTTQIDRLINKKKELIEKLLEQRTANITYALTKGRASNVVMKESHIQWFDSLPSHWQIIRLKDLVIDAIAGPYGSSLTKSMYTNSGYRVYGQQQVIPENFTIGDYYVSDEKYEEMQRYRTLPGDILISVMGTIGRAALVTDDAEPGIINPRLVLYRANKSIIRPAYLKSFINSLPSQNYFSLVAQGTTMEGINMALIGELAVPVPPLHEQDEILIAQQSQKARLEKQIQTVACAIARLQEYRSALITAAVTGQIDVRDWQAPEHTEPSSQDKDVA